MRTNYWKKVGIPAVVAVRLILPFFLWKSPLVVWGLIFVVDWFDGDIFRQAYNYQRNDLYQPFDKALDLYGYCFALIFSFTSKASIFNVLLFLFLLRALGTVIFLIKREKKIFTFFPNIFENLFIVYLLTFTFPFLNFLLKGGRFYLTFLILSIIAVVREYFLRIRGFQLYELRTGKRWV